MKDNTSLKLDKIVGDAEDFLPILGTDYVEFYVSNAKQIAHYYQSAWGFQPVAYKGLETGSKDVVSYVLQQDKIRFVLTSPLDQGGDINKHIDKHGDGVKVMALWVDDAKKSWEETTKRGAKSYLEPETIEDEHGTVVRSGIHTYGERSEEHTSELQSRFDFVCRLLLEKKKFIIEKHIIILYFTLTILIGNLCSSTNLINY